MSKWIGTGLLAIVGMLVWSASAQAEAPVQPSWRCQVGSQVIMSNTPCKLGAQPIRAGSSVIYRCEQKGVVSFQQSACKEAEAPVHLHNDVRTKASIASAEQVRKQTVSQANRSRQEQLSREKADNKVTVIGVQKGTGYGGDGKADGYRDARGDTGSHSGY